MKFNSLYQRVLILCPLTALLLLLLFKGEIPLLQLLFFLLVASLLLVTLFEFSRLRNQVCLPALFIASTIYLGVLFLHQGTLLLPFHALFLPIASLLFLLITFTAVDDPIGQIEEFIFTLYYLVYPFGFALDLFLHDSFRGRLWLFYLISIAKVGDIAGYFFGQRWGVTKLAPTISPGKTVVGACAALGSALFVSWMMGYFVMNISTIEAFVLGGAISLLAQGGDLFESTLKRAAKVKDSGQWPGVGGALDLVDSLLLPLPPLYFYYLFRYHAEY